MLKVKQIAMELNGIVRQFCDLHDRMYDFQKAAMLQGNIGFCVNTLLIYGREANDIEKVRAEAIKLLDKHHETLLALEGSQDIATALKHQGAIQAAIRITNTVDKKYAVDIARVMKSIRDNISSKVQEEQDALRAQEAEAIKAKEEAEREEQMNRFASQQAAAQEFDL